MLAYATRFADVLIRERQPESEFVIVYSDESYINTNHSNTFTWINPSDDKSRELAKGTGKGKRAIIFHAITKHGLLEKVEANGSVSCTAKKIWEAGKTEGDYHENVDGPPFQTWVRDHLIPTFDRFFPGKKMIFIIDNAPYHAAPGPQTLKYKSKKKADLCDVLPKKDIGEIEVTKGDNRLRFKVEDVKKAAIARTRIECTVEDLKSAIERNLTPQERLDGLHWIFHQRGWKIMKTVRQHNRSSRCGHGSRMMLQRSSKQVEPYLK